jgi:hypothetical protein
MIDYVDPEDFYNARNLNRALQSAESVARALIAGETDPIMRQGEMQLALEVLCDAPGGDTARAYEVVVAIEARYRRPEMWESDGPTADRLRIACWLALAAEVAHRDGRYRQAVVHCQTAFRYLDEAAGSRKELMRRVGSSKSDSVAEAATAVFAIWLAALRRASYPPIVKSQFRSGAPELLGPIMASGQVYPRTHALATQALFDAAEEGEIEGLEELRQISDATRPDSLRASATAPLVSMEFARAQGMSDVAEREGERAAELITAFGLPRHLERIAEFDYLRAG